MFGKFSLWISHIFAFWYQRATIGNDLCPSWPALDVAVISRSQSAVMHREADLQPSLGPDPDNFPADVESDSASKSVEAGLASLFKSSVATETLPSEVVDRTELIRLQQSDPVLFSLFERAEKGDERYFFKVWSPCPNLL